MRKAVTAAVTAVSLLGATALAAPALTAPKAKVAARAGAHPDLNGVWQTLNGANWNIEPHAASASPALRPGPGGVPIPTKEVVALGAVGSVPAGLGVVVGGAIPYKPEALKKRDENRAKWLERDPEIKCYLPGVPRATYMGLPFQILQSDKQILFAYEYASAVRNIALKDPGEAPIDSWMGQSYGRWEGNSLVVTVTGLNDSTWLDRAGNHHSDQMKVVERYTPIDATHLRYEAEITDPETYTRPWKMEMVLYKRIGADARLQQFKCVEFVEELMYGKLRKNPVQ